MQQRLRSGVEEIVEVSYLERQREVIILRYSQFSCGRCSRWRVWLQPLATLKHRTLARIGVGPNNSGRNVAPGNDCVAPARIQDYAVRFSM